MKKRVPHSKGTQPNKKPRIGDSPGKVKGAQRPVGIPKMSKASVRYRPQTKTRGS